MAGMYGALDPGYWAALGSPTQAESTQLSQYLQAQKLAAELQVKQQELALNQAKFNETQGLDRAEYGLKASKNQREEVAEMMKLRQESLARYQAYITNHNSLIEKATTQLVNLMNHSGGLLGVDKTALKRRLGYENGLLEAWKALTKGREGATFTHTQVQSMWDADKKKKNLGSDPIEAAIYNELYRQADDPSKQAEFFNNLKAEAMTHQAAYLGQEAATGTNDPGKAQGVALMTAYQNLWRQRKEYNPKEAQEWVAMELGPQGTSETKGQEQPKKETPRSEFGGYIRGSDGKTYMLPAAGASDDTKSAVDRYNASDRASRAPIFNPRNPEDFQRAREYFDAFRNPPKPSEKPSSKEDVEPRVVTALQADVAGELPRPKETKGGRVYHPAMSPVGGPLYKRIPGVYIDLDPKKTRQAIFGRVPAPQVKRDEVGEWRNRIPVGPPATTDQEEYYKSVNPDVGEWAKRIP